MTGPILSAQLRLSEVSDWLSRLGGALEGIKVSGALDFWEDSPAHAYVHLHFPDRSHALLFARDHLTYGAYHKEKEWINNQTMYMTELPSFRVTLFYPTPSTS